MIRSEYTSRDVYSGLCLFLSIVYSVFQRCPTRDEISFPVGQSAKSKIPYHLIIYIFLGLTWLRCFAWFIVCFFLNLLYLFGFPNCLPHHIFVSVPSQDLDFQRQCRGLFCIYWFAVMVGYSFCQIFSYRCLKCFFFCLHCIVFICYVTCIYDVKLIFFYSTIVLFWVLIKGSIAI